MTLGAPCHTTVIILGRTKQGHLLDSPTDFSIVAVKGSWWKTVDNSSRAKLFSWSQQNMKSLLNDSSWSHIFALDFYNLICFIQYILNLILMKVACLKVQLRLPSGDYPTEKIVPQTTSRLVPRWSCTNCKVSSDLTRPQWIGKILIMMMDSLIIK